MNQPTLAHPGRFSILVFVFHLFASVSALTTSGVLVGYIMLYRMCLFSINIPLTNLNIRIHRADQVRMGQGLLGMLRNIGAALGVTVSSVIFERRRAYHQLLAMMPMLFITKRRMQNT